jgi:predicted lysophospholipase L1 biosynthesis ABC-type transport system permease subunit
MTWNSLKVPDASSHLEIRHARGVNWLDNFSRDLLFGFRLWKKQPGAFVLINHQIVGYYLASLLLAICGGASLFLASLGIFGLTTLSVNQRTREVGVRLALGATRRRIITTLLTRALWQITAGLSFGTILAFALDRILSHSIAGYPTLDSPALVFLGTGVFLATISLVAVLIPALSGARVDPMTALRYE